MTDTVFTVRSRFGARQFTAGLLFTVFSVLFVLGGAIHPGRFGGILFLALGCAGVLLFASGTVVVAGRGVSRRPAIVFDSTGVRLPAQWPRGATADKFLPWPEVAAIVATDATAAAPSTRRRRLRSFRLVFLPTVKGAPASPEMLALCVTKQLPGTPTVHWSVRVMMVTGGPSVEEIVAAAQSHRDAPFLDARESTARTR